MVTTDIMRLKESVSALLKDESYNSKNIDFTTKDKDNGPLKFTEMVNKSTFVITDEDLKVLNEDMEKQLLINKFDDFNSSDEDEYDDDYADNYDAQYDDEMINEDINEYENDKTVKESNHLQPQNQVLSNPINDDIDSDADLDSTHFLYDPPIKYKDKFLIYVLKSSPLLVVGLIIFFLSGIISHESLLNFKHIAHHNQDSNMTPFLTHKLYLLEEEIKSLKSLENLGIEITNLHSDIESLKEHIQQIELMNPVVIESEDSSFISSFNRMDKLEKKIDSLTEIINNELSNKDLLENLKGQINELSVKNKVNKPQLFSDDWSTYPSSGSMSNELLPHLRNKKLSLKYYNIANKCNVLRQLTSHPPLSERPQRRRKSFPDRIIHGFPDFLKRVWKSKNTNNSRAITQGLKTFGNIKLMSQFNSPRNALIEQSGLFWQNRACDMPLYYSIGMETPSKLHEVGIYHSRQEPSFIEQNEITDKDISTRWIHAAPKNVELLLRPESSQIKSMKTSLSRFYNQDLKFSSFLPEIQKYEWIRAGELEYDINSNRGYQPFVWDTKIQKEIAKWDICELMLVIHNNWGDEIVALDTLRIFKIPDVSEDDIYEKESNAENFLDRVTTPFLGEMSDA